MSAASQRDHPGTWRSRRFARCPRRPLSLLLLLIWLPWCNPAAAQIPPPEGIAALIECMPRLLGNPPGLHSAVTAFLAAEASGDFLEIGDVAMRQVYRVMQRTCPGEATDLLRELSIIAFLHGGAAARMLSETQQFISDLTHRGLGS